MVIDITINGASGDDYVEYWYGHLIQKNIKENYTAKIFIGRPVKFVAYGKFKIIEVFYTAGFILIIFVSIVNHFAERQKSGSYKSHILGYILAALFMGSNVLIFQSSSAEIISIISMIVLAGVFIIVFLLTFIWMDETEF